MCLALMCFNKQMVHVIECDALARKTDLGKMFWYLHSNCAKKSGWYFSILLSLKTEFICHSMYLCTVIGQKSTKTKFTEFGKQKQVKKNIEMALIILTKAENTCCASDQRMKSWLGIINVFSGSRQVHCTLVRYILSSHFYSLGEDI